MNILGEITTEAIAIIVTLTLGVYLYLKSKGRGPDDFNNSPPAIG